MENKLCIELHKLLTSDPSKVFKSPKDVHDKKCSGVYFFFEDGETYHGMSKIVRVGTHAIKKTSNVKLYKRITQHYGKNHRASVMRQIIGGCLLVDDGKADYWDIWRKQKKNNPVDAVYEKELEERISEYMEEHMSFTYIEVEDKEERKRLEKAAISLLAQTDDFKCSQSWMGLKCPKAEVREECGLWLSAEKNKEPMTEEELAYYSSLFLKK